MSKESKKPEAAEDKKISTPDNAGESGNGFTIDKALDGFSPENRGVFSKVSEGGKKIAGFLFSGVEKIPGVITTVDKIKIAHSQFWSDKHGEKMVGLRNKAEGLQLKDELLGKSEEEIKKTINGLEEAGMPGAASLQLKLKELGQERLKLKDKKDSMETKFNERENKMNLYSNKRDAIADKLISRYGEKLKPMEKELERLESCKNKTDLLVAVAKGRHEEQMIKLQEMENKKTKIENILKDTGSSARKVKNFEAVKLLEKEINKGKDRIKKEEEGLAKMVNKINKKIAVTDIKADPYREKINKFIRVKNNQPVEIKSGRRVREADASKEKEIKAHTMSGTEESQTKTRETRPVPRPEGEIDLRKPTATDFVASWNSFVEKQADMVDRKNKRIDIKDFLIKTRLFKGERMNLNLFKGVLERYFVAAFGKQIFVRVSGDIDKFFKDKLAE